MHVDWSMRSKMKVVWTELATYLPTSTWEGPGVMVSEWSVCSLDNILYSLVWFVNIFA